MGQHVEIRDVGPIEHLSFDLPGDGGVVVYQGPNGSGKSHAVDAVASLTDKRLASKLGLSTRDGADVGTIDGFGVTLTLGRRTSARGELEVRTISAADPSLLVDPGYDDDAVADEHRLRALCRLAGVQPDVAAFAKLFDLIGGERRMRAIARPTTFEKTDVPAMAEALRTDIQKAARQFEATAENEGGRAAGFFDGVRDVDLTVPSDAAALQGAVEAATRELVQAEERQRGQQRACASRKLAADDAAKLAATLEPNYEVDRLRERVAQIETERLRDEAGLARVREEISRLTDVAGELALGMRGRASESSGLVARIDAYVQRREALAALQRAAAAPADDEDSVTQEHLDALRAGKHAAALKADQGAVVRRALEQRAEGDAALARAREAERIAASLRAAAKGVDEVVSSAISSVAPRGLTVRGGRLYVATDRDVELFTRLSAGERWRVALDVAIDAVGEGGQLAIRQEAWEGLDPSNRADIAAHAAARRVWIHTAEATDGTLRATIYQPGAAS